LAFSNKLRAAPDVAGLKDLDAPCQATYPDVKPVCENPDAHYYWDEWHPTRKVHTLAAEAMLETLKASRYDRITSVGFVQSETAVGIDTRRNAPSRSTHS
jgi:phospholipase/lecithinase/hemolysin